MRQVLLYDTTLRDGMQGQGMSLSAQEKVRVVSKLDQLGIHFIEAGFPGSNPKELELFRLLELSARALRPGGVLVAETINPLSPFALRNYFADLTHAQPLVPETLEVLARQAGFAETEIRFLNEPAERLTEPDDPVIAANVRRLNELLFAPLDYALVARTATDA